MATIGLDLDGVLYDWHNAVLEYYKIYKNYDGSFDDFWSKAYKEFTPDDWEYLTGVDTFYSSEIPSESCLKFLERLSMSFELFYVTSRPETCRLTTEQYLRRYKFPFSHNLVMEKNKVSVARLYGTSYFVEDMPETVEKLSHVTTAILMARPWNHQFWDVYPTIRTLDEAWRFIKEVQ